MSIPSLPTFFDMVFTKDGGRLSSDGYLYLDQQFQALNAGVSDLNTITSSFVQRGTDNPYGLTPLPPQGQLVVIGLTPPSFTTAQITAISNAVNPDGSQVVPVGTMWYNSTLKKLQFKADIGAIETITSTP